MQKTSLLLNPGHPFGERFLDELQKLPDMRVVGVCSLPWRRDALAARPDIEGRLDHVISCPAEHDRAKAQRIVDELSARDLHPSVVVAWDDASTTLAGHLADMLGISWNSAEVAARFHEKHQMKALLAASTDLRVNRFALCADVEQALAFQRRLDKWPVVVKPASSGGTWCVRFASSAEEIRSAIELITTTLDVYEGKKHTGALLEELVTGPEYCVNGQTDKHGNVLITDIFVYDKRPANGQPNVYFHDTYVNPRLHDVTDLVAYAAAVVRAAGLRNAPFHCEMKVDADGPCLIEVACRPPGGLMELMCRTISPDIYELAVRGYMGELELPKEIDLRVPPVDIEALMLLGVSYQEGVVSAVHGLERVQALPSFKGVFHCLGRGDRIHPTVDVDTMPYWIFLASEDRAQLERDKARVRELIRFETL